MGKQVNFYLTESDTRIVEKAIRELEPVIVLHMRSDDGRPRILDSLSFKGEGNYWLYYDIVREPDLGSIPLSYVNGANYWKMDVLTSPIVEFSRSFYDGKLMRRGRIYFIESYFDENDALVFKNEDFLKWARKILRVVRKILFKHGTDYLGPEAKELLERSEIVLSI